MTRMTIEGFRTIDDEWKACDEAQCQFIEISDSREYASDFDSTEEPREGSIINII